MFSAVIASILGRHGVPIPTSDAFLAYQQANARKIPNAGFFQRHDKHSLHPGTLEGLGLVQNLVNISQDADKIIALFITEYGSVGAARPSAQLGDMVSVLSGGSMPFILRPRGQEYVLIGPCFLPGCMDREAIETWKQGTLVVRSSLTTERPPQGSSGVRSTF
ncbi:hypothetical protein B0T25DRAFT_220645 [Lasiosphaeria hispida]|uniref:Uncharacterized protein n=1 Tax=Lasiosphaeria hispida TaxID=260671 RepID=A0AAJ0HJI3_9PEZI|nr:hypothetical protein B0T25DRAFT_220645 [Lasiosphaeria hispida]